MEDFLSKSIGAARSDTPPPPAPTTPALQHIYANYNEAYSRIMEMNKRLEYVRSRLFGDNPTTAANRPSRNTRYANGGLGELDGMSVQINDSLDYTAELIEALESVA